MGWRCCPAYPAASCLCRHGCLSCTPLLLCELRSAPSAVAARMAAERRRQQPDGGWAALPCSAEFAVFVARASGVMAWCLWTVVHLGSGDGGTCHYNAASLSASGHTPNAPNA